MYGKTCLALFNAQTHTHTHAETESPIFNIKSKKDTLNVA